MKKYAQELTENEFGELQISDDWYPAPLPRNICLGEMTYPDTAYSFATFFSEQKEGFELGFGSGNYGHSIFSAGKQGKIKVGKFVVLECTNIIANLSVTIGDSCMFSWGSVITDSWIHNGNNDVSVRRKMLQDLSSTETRHPEFYNPLPVIIEDNVWVGFDAVILPGVRVGKGAVVGCKTIVSEDVPAYAVVVGNPAKIIKFLNPTDTEQFRLQAIKEFTSY